MQRALREAQLPLGKSFTNFEFEHCPTLNAAALMQWVEQPSWLERSENLILLGPSGVGKTHLAAGVGQRAIQLGKRVKFFPATTLVQQLQYAKLQLQLPTTLTKLDRFDLLVLDDLGYVKKDEAETSVLFELYAFGGAKLYAHRYERRSLLITANQPFSQWDAIFSDSMMTVAAVDRLVHHALIIEIQAESFRKQSAVERSKQK
jgi:DNA replication protein DnaC